MGSLSLRGKIWTLSLKGRKEELVFQDEYYVSRPWLIDGWNFCEFESQCTKVLYFVLNKLYLLFKFS